MKPEDILEHCLKELEAGRKTPAECAALFPNIPGLEAQLLAAASLRHLEVLAPRPEASRRIEARTLKGISDLRQKIRARKPTPIRRRLPTLRWAMPFALITSLLFGMVGTVAAAASESAPGNPLYPVKRASETVQVILTPAPEQASLHATLAQRRLDEIIALYQLGTVDLNLLTDLTTETEIALAAAEDAPPEEQSELLNAIILLTDRQQAILTTVKASAPPQAQAGLDRAIEASSHNHGVAQGHLEQGPPSNVGPDSSAPTDTTPEGPNCKANNPNSPNDCTPTPVSISATPSPTPCAAQNGKSTKSPKCRAVRTPCPAEKPGRGSKCK